MPAQQSFWAKLELSLKKILTLTFDCRPARTKHTLPKIPAKIQKVKTGGGGGIRTHVRLKAKTVFKTVTISLSVTPPQHKSISSRLADSQTKPGDSAVGINSVWNLWSLPILGQQQPDEPDILQSQLGLLLPDCRKILLLGQHSGN